MYENECIFSVCGDFYQLILTLKSLSQMNISTQGCAQTTFSTVGVKRSHSHFNRAAASAQQGS